MLGTRATAALLAVAVVGLLAVTPASGRDAGAALEAAILQHARTGALPGIAPDQLAALDELDDHAGACPTEEDGAPVDPELRAALEDEGRALFASTTAFAQGESVGPTVYGERLACISCHTPPAYTDGRTHLVGPTESRPLVPRHTPHLLRIADDPSFGWDGRFPCLQASIRNAILSPLEMAAARAPTQRQLDALAAFVETLDVPDAVPGEDFDPDLAQWGEQLFAEYRGRDVDNPQTLWDGISCLHCHAGPGGPYGDFHRIVAPLPLAPVALDPGKVDEDGRIRGFKTPVLRGVRLTAPYFHDGSMGQPTGARIPTVDDPPIGALLVMMEAYERRFLMSFTPEERLALVHYMLSL
jgi:hypothetical protein